jgi:hypothetical protein
MTTFREEEGSSQWWWYVLNVCIYTHWNLYSSWALLGENNVSSVEIISSGAVNWTFFYLFTRRQLNAHSLHRSWPYAILLLWVSKYHHHIWSYLVNIILCMVLLSKDHHPLVVPQPGSTISSLTFPPWPFHSWWWRNLGISLQTKRHSAAPPKMKTLVQHKRDLAPIPCLVLLNLLLSKKQIQLSSKNLGVPASKL